MKEQYIQAKHLNATTVNSKLTQTDFYAFILNQSMKA